MCRFFPRPLCVILLVVAAGWRGANADPNHKDPTKPMAVHGVDPSVSLQEACQQRYDSANKALLDLAEMDNKRQLERAQPKQLTVPHIQLSQMQRFATQLRIWGEPAGHDFMLRAQSLQAPLQQIVITFRGTQAAQKYNQLARQYIQKQAKPRENELRRIDELIKQGSWPEAEAALLAMYDKYDEVTLFLSSSEQPIYQQLEARRLPIDTAMTALRKKAATQSLVRRLNEQVTNLDQLIQELTAATAAVKTSGSGVVAEQTMTGPELVQHFNVRWQQALAAMLRYRGLFWAIRAQETSYSTLVAASPTPQKIDDLISTGYEKFVTEISAGLIGLIEADAARVSEADAPALYVAYLQAFAPLAARSFESETSINPLRDRIAAAVAKVAARSPALAANASAYQVATDDLLVWRRRTASAQARATAFEPLEAPFQKASKLDQSFPGLWVEGATNAAQPELLKSSPETVPALYLRLANKTVSVRHLSGLAGGKSMLSRYSAGTYVTCRSTVGSCAASIAALRNDLLVTDQTPPLSLAAAVAIDSAERGDAVLLGGRISGMHVEGLITRYATVPDSVWPLDTLSMSIATVKTDIGKLGYVVVRFDLQPQWVQHEYFFANLAAATPETN